MTTDLVQWLRPRKGVTAHFASWGWPSDLPLYLKLGGLFQTQKRAGEEERQRAQVFNSFCSRAATYLWRAESTSEQNQREA